jgi:beta-glucuronidase
MIRYTRWLGSAVNISNRWLSLTRLAMCALAVTWCATIAPAQGLKEQTPTVVAAADHRASTSLNGPWHAIIDPYQTGLFDFHGHARNDGYAMNAKQSSPGQLVEYSFAKSPTLQVPGDWNTQRESLMFYEGTVWYEKDFTYKKNAGKRVFLHIGAANYRSYVWVNTIKICEHEGGFTGFDCEVTAALQDGDNFAVIAVDNTRLPDGIPTIKTDWWNYGGLTRDVYLFETPEQYIDAFDLHLKRGSADTIEGWVHVEGAPAASSVKVSLADGATATGAIGGDGKAQIVIHDSKLQLWSPQTPKLYQVTIESGADKLQDDMGFRTIEVRGTQILLNGKPIFLKGMSVHAEAPYRTGRAYSENDAETLLGWIHELGGNYVRLAHYPHDERMTRLADRMGILVWSEIPVYWACHFDDPAVLKKAEAQLTEEIRRDRDKASIILWSVANETPNTPPRTKFLTTLAGDVREQDQSRLVTAALLVRGEGNTKIVDDPLGNALDVIGANEYIGWYEKTAADADQTHWDIRYEKPLIMSEWGGGAKAGLHGDAGTRWTEEFQASIYEHQLQMLNQIPQLRGMSPWVLMDFRSPMRELPGIQDFYNRKGVVSEDGKKKKAFFILQKAYTENTIGHAE